MAQALVREGFTVISPGHRAPGLLDTIARGLRRDQPRRADVETVIAELVAARPDVVFAPVGSDVVPLVPAGVPVAYCSDATARLLSQGYGNADRMTPDELADAEARERRSIARADRCIFPSAWAAKSAVDDYGADPAKVKVAPFGAEVDIEASVAERRRLGPVLRLLWIGADWRRKGGELALQTQQLLEQSGRRTELHMCGARPPPKTRLPDGVIHHGFVDRGSARGTRLFHELLRLCDVFLLPTRADCWALVLGEAAAAGMPAVATKVGGVGEVIRHDVTGALVPLDGDAQAFADAVLRITADQDAYAGYATRARQEFEQRLNWSNWAKIVGAELRAVMRAP